MVAGAGGGLVAGSGNPASSVSSGRVEAEGCGSWEYNEGVDDIDDIDDNDVMSSNHGMGLHACYWCYVVIVIVGIVVIVVIVSVATIIVPHLCPYG